MLDFTLPGRYMSCDKGEQVRCWETASDEIGEKKASTILFCQVVCKPIYHDTYSVSFKMSSHIV